MKLKSFTIVSLVLSSISGLSNAASGHPARALVADRIGFSKRQDQWIGGAALYASECPGDLQNCGTETAQSWCCPQGTFCKDDYCCPNGNSCDTIVRTFPSCADPSWTLCTYSYIGSQYYCCQSDEQCYLALGAPACGPSNLPLQSSQKVSTVSPSYTRTISSITGSSVSSMPTPSSTFSSPTPISHSSSALVSDSKSQVIPSITRSTGITQTSSGSATSAAAGNDQTTGTSSATSSMGSSSSSGLSSGAIAGIVIGAVAGLALVALVGVLSVRYGSKKAIESYTAAASTNMANVSPPVYNAPEGFPVSKPEGVEIGGTGYRGLPGDRVELGGDGSRV